MYTVIYEHVHNKQKIQCFRSGVFVALYQRLSFTLYCYCDESLIKQYLVRSKRYQTHSNIIKWVSDRKLTQKISYKLVGVELFPDYYNSLLFIDDWKTESKHGWYEAAIQTDTLRIYTVATAQKAMWSWCCNVTYS